MLYAFGFDRVGVVISDLYFLDPNQTAGQEGAERGVRLEVRLLERQELNGSVYSAQPIGIGQPVWRADLLEQVKSRPGSYDRTHHHPNFVGWEPGRRVFEPALSADPVTFVGEQLADLPLLLKQAGLDDVEVSNADAEALRTAVPEILEATRRLLARVHAGELGQAPSDATELISARIGWL
jgi:hypothetical protein